MNTTIIEIAKKAGVSTATVSRAFNNNGSIREATRRKILQIASEFNYRPNLIARGLSRKKTDTIGIILPEIVNDFFTEIVHGIDEEAYKNNNHILVSSSHSTRNDVETLLDMMGGGHVDGIILMAPLLRDDIVELVRKSKRPVVLLNVDKELKDIVSINIDNYQGAYTAVTHLISHGYKNIAMIKGPAGNCDAEERFRGYIDALKHNDITISKELMVSGEFKVQSGYYAFTRLINQKIKPDAIFAANDMMAIGVYEAARSAGLNIPKDFAVVGFDDIQLGRLLYPRLTTVHVPIAELGKKAIQYLFKMIENNIDPQKPYREELSVGLVIGGSCGCNNSTINFND